MAEGQDLHDVGLMHSQHHEEIVEHPAVAAMCHAAWFLIEDRKTVLVQTGHYLMSL